jgi:hypothetical protein
MAFRCKTSSAILPSFAYASFTILILVANLEGLPLAKSGMWLLLNMGGKLGCF